MTGPQPDQPTRRRVLEGWVALVVLVAGLALVALVSRSGDTRDISGRNRPYRPPRPPKPETVGSGQAPPPPTPTASEGGSAPGWFADLMRILAIVAAAVFVLLVIRYLIKTFRVLDLSKLRGTKTDPDDLEFAPAELTQALSDAVDETLIRIERGEPRDAIVACWVRLEDVAAQAGIERRPSETSAELTQRVLSTHWVTDERLDGLSQLYREARYSSHTMTEDARQRARIALEEIRAELAEHVRLAREAAEVEAAEAAEAQAEERR